MSYIIKARSKFPKCLRYFETLKGISVGKCINKHRGFDDHGEEIEYAHAHCLLHDPYRGWICLRYKYCLKDRYLLLHEIAHLIANVSEDIPDHGNKWKKVIAWLTAIGGEREHPHLKYYR